MNVVTAVRRYGHDPALFAAMAEHRLRERWQGRVLRARYSTAVASPRCRATLRAPSIDLPLSTALPAELRGAADRLGEEAEATLAHRMSFLGSGPVGLGPEIDWHRDFKSGYRWPEVFYQDLEITRLDDHSDAKVPWELSRGHQLLTLARAARIHHDERFATELEAQLCSWLDANPTGYGINWVTPMEIAFRAVNWGWAIGTLEGWRPLDDELRRRVTRSLQAHGRHIARHLEGSPALRGNHYLADVLGLFALATFLPDDPDSRRWARRSRRELEREIRAQVHDDGVGFEASLPYHGLSLEMFLLAWHIAQRSGQPLSDRYRARLVAMLEVSRAVRHPDGRVPVFGDQDSGRVLPAGFARPATQDNLLDLGAALLDLPRQRDAPPDEEVAWTLGIDRWQALAARAVDAAPRRTAFPQGGLYVLDGGGAHMVVRWGEVGQNGHGGHGHNDLSSFELSYGTPIVVDSGSYVYTADIAARDAFRSAAAHNVLAVDGLDMHPLPARTPFRMPAHASFQVEELSLGSRYSMLTGSHDGFRRNGCSIRCRRRIVLDRDTGVVQVTDEVDGTGRRSLESLLHLASSCRATVVGDQGVVVHGPRDTVTVDFSGATSVRVEEGWVSSEYGVRERAPVIRAAAISELPATLSYRLAPR